MALKVRTQKSSVLLWIGLNYQFDSALGEFKPVINVQVPLFEKYAFQDRSDSSSFKAISTKFSLKNYSDPFISVFYISILKNFEKHVSEKNIKYPDSYAIGFDFSLVLNPKASINFNFEQRYQTALKEDGAKVNPTKTLPTMGLGATYSINSKNSFTVSSNIGTSSSSPDSIVSVALWHKF